MKEVDASSNLIDSEGTKIIATRIKSGSNKGDYELSKPRGNKLTPPKKKRKN